MLICKEFLLAIFLVVISFFLIKTNVYSDDSYYCNDGAQVVTCASDLSYINVKPPAPGIEFRKPCDAGTSCQVKMVSTLTCYQCKPTYIPPTFTNTYISGTITIGTTGPVPSNMHVCISISGPGHTYAPCKDFGTGGSKTPGYSFSIDTISSLDGQTATDVHGSVEINGQTGSVIGGTIVFGKQNNDLDMSINLSNASACSASNCSACTIAADCWGVSNNACKWGAARCETNTSGTPGTGAKECTSDASYERQCANSTPSSFELDPESTTPYSCNVVGQPGKTCYRKLKPGVTSSPPPATPDPSDPNSCINVDNNDSAFACQASCTGTYSQPYTKTPYNKCVTDQCCYNPAKYPRSQIGNPSGGGSTTPAPGGGTSTPGGGTPGPSSGPCSGVKGGVLSYVNGTCNEKLFDATKAAAREFCGGVYKDKYICQNIDPSTSQRYVDYVPSGGNTCSSPPWCPATGGTTTPSPTVGPDANCTAYQGQTCHPNDYSNKIYCCEPNKNLECTNPNPLYPNSYTCQYKPNAQGTPAPFTPTPGASNNCSATNFGNWGVGCACPTGGGCGGTLGCYKEASGKVFPPDNPSGQFCATGRWCAQSQTDVQNTAACMSATPYVSPSPTGSSGGGSGYQADCPYYNAAGGLTNNECQDGTQCLAGYDHAPIGPGGTNGDRVCSETNGRPNVCCTKRPGGSTTTTTPAPGGGTTAPVPSTTTAPAPTSSYTPPSSCVGHPANSMCGSASEANMQCFYPGGTGYWGWKGEGNGCDLGSGTQTNCYVCTP